MAQQDDVKKDDNAEEGYPSVGLTYHLYPFKGVNTDRKFLSCTKNGKTVDLWTDDDKSGRQQWLIQKEVSDTVYNIKVWDGVSGDRTLLSCTNDGKTVDLWNVDDGSGRQQWTFEKIFETGDDKYIFHVFPKSGLTTDRKYLSCTQDGKTVDLWDKDDESGRQQWVLELIDEMKLSQISFTIDDGKIVDTTPLIAQKNVFTNKSDVQQSLEWKFKLAETTESTFTYEGGFTISVSVEGEIGIPFVSKGKITAGFETTHTFTTGKTTSETTEEEFSFPLAVPPHSSLSAEAIIVKSKMDVPYIATFISKLSGNKVVQTGIWKGTSYGSVTYTIEPLTNAK